MYKYGNVIMTDKSEKFFVFESSFNYISGVFEDGKSAVLFEEDVDFVLPDTELKINVNGRKVIMTASGYKAMVISDTPESVLGIQVRQKMGLFENGKIASVLDCEQANVLPDKDFVIKAFPYKEIAFEISDSLTQESRLALKTNVFQKGMAFGMGFMSVKDVLTLFENTPFLSTFRICEPTGSMICVYFRNGKNIHRLNNDGSIYDLFVDGKKTKECFALIGAELKYAVESEPLKKKFHELRLEYSDVLKELHLIRGGIYASQETGEYPDDETFERLNYLENRRKELAAAADKISSYFLNKKEMKFKNKKEDK